MNQNSPSQFLVTTIFNYIYIPIGIFGLLLVALMFLIVYRFFDKKTENNKGKEIEESINPKITILKLEKLIRKSILQNQNQHTIIYYFYRFRMYCQEVLKIRNARIINSEKILKLLRGNPNISFQEVQRLSDLYVLARYKNEEIRKEDCTKMKFLLERIIDH
ncbi:MAG TPA: hypothetical protein VMX55_14345 [candidate division Zixibacteria bacterium]|nr:hypothetical protein [candidate division Zixibacteria bacterium]